MASTRHHNLSNPDCEPARAAVKVECTVHFDQYRGPFPKRKFQDWLESLPEQAKVEFTGFLSGKPQFTASWMEER